MRPELGKIVRRGAREGNRIPDDAGNTCFWIRTVTEPARESPLLAGAVELESESWWLSRPEPLEDAIVREGVMNACRSFVDGEESDIDLDRIEDFFELLDFENTPAAPGLIEFLRFLSRHDGDIGSLAAHRLDVWGVEGPD